MGASLAAFLPPFYSAFLAPDVRFTAPNSACFPPIASPPAPGTPTKKKGQPLGQPFDRFQ